ncbi:MAG: GNAT family protein [Methanobacteriota archaeon]
MKDYPTLNSDRLILRQFHPEEAMVVKNLAGDYKIAHGCLTVPHPYGIGLAESWIACHEEWYSSGIQLVLAIIRKEDGWLIGAVGLMLDQDHNRAEIGYWIGVPFWGCGYATEAAEAAVAYTFEEMLMNRVTATIFMRNPASGRVLEKIGMRQEGILKKHLLKEGTYEDVLVFGILHEEWRADIGRRKRHISRAYQ